MTPRISGNSVPVIPMPACVTKPIATSALWRATYGYRRMSCDHPETRLCAVFGTDPERVFAAALIEEWIAESPVTGLRSETFLVTGRKIDIASHSCSSVHRKLPWFDRNFASCLHEPRRICP